ncbi:histone acetyltransferase complex SAGA/ADAsubunit ADA2 [Encephalitozoon cuniculi EcunIII-L]|uniref:Transcriptional adaptator n=1 Tax=Encephalitozoon cuniculi TaxID=6035 RepID=M1KJ49_ENCCN|nr:transcriptional adaptator [Encephalitozoon cuniculi]KMV66225.1 histone acetyltransferase complex SAGA/ADAsubunit ADA2 [Encephalitozoon cuniculi EcunIII-L]UYI27398.1 hypothetical protein J0A71_06g12670 [Encephalitozoon cuniculi]
MAISCSDQLGGVSILCDYCFLMMTDLTYIKCNECAVDLCLRCFVNQIETSVHSKYHGYRVVSKMNAKIGEEGWTLLEEILFVECLDTCGIGNWEGISRYIGAGRDIKSHFYKMLDLQESTSEFPRINPKVSNPYRGAISSYMPYRRDFDVEYMDEHEVLIRDLSVDGSKEELKKKITNATLDSYMRLVRFRNRRKHAILGKNLMDMQNLKKKDEECGFVNSIKWIAPYLTKSDFNVFFRGVYIEKRLHELLNRRNRENRDAMDVKNILPSKYFVSDKERRLCETYNLSPGMYLELKKEVISCFIRRGEFTKEDFNRLFGFLGEADGLYGLFLERGWIHEEKETK